MTTTDPQMNTSMQVKLEISKSLPSPFFKNQYAQKNKYENCKICWNMMFVSVNRDYQIFPKDRWSGSPVQHVRQGNWEMQRHRHWRIHEGRFIISYLQCKIFIFVNMVLPTSVHTWSGPLFILFLQLKWSASIIFSQNIYFEFRIFLAFNTSRPPLSVHKKNQLNRSSR